MIFSPTYSQLLIIPSAVHVYRLCPVCLFGRQYKADILIGNLVSVIMILPVIRSHHLDIVIIPLFFHRDQLNAVMFRIFFRQHIRFRIRQKAHSHYHTYANRRDAHPKYRFLVRLNALSKENGHNRQIATIAHSTQGNHFGAFRKKSRSTMTARISHPAAMLRLSSSKK